MPWGAVAGAAVGLIGSSMQADAAGDAAAGQQRASAESNALQRYMYDRNVELQMPTINTGNAARDRLSYLLGLSPNGFSGTINGAPRLTYDQLRQQLVGQYTRQNTAPNAAPMYRNGMDAVKAGNAQTAHDFFQRNAIDYSSDDQLTRLLGYAPEGALWRQGSGQANDGVHGDEWYMPEGQQGPGSYIDETALDAAIRARLAEQDAAQRALEEAAKNDPNYGILSQRYVPKEFSYTGEDLYKDPSYQFRLEQGQKALDRAGAAAGRFLSGRQLQASSDYNQGAASQEFQSAYNRALNTFSTNEGNRFNAYQANFNNAVNPLLALSGAATLGSQNLGSAGANMANQVGANLTNNANAQGAAGIASANSIAGGLNNAYNGYQQNQLLNNLIKNNGGVNNNPGAWNTPATNWAFGTGGMGD